MSMTDVASIVRATPAGKKYSQALRQNYTAKSSKDAFLATGLHLFCALPALIAPRQGRSQCIARRKVEKVT
jgi:hypothetical protein